MRLRRLVRARLLDGPRFDRHQIALSQHSAVPSPSRKIHAGAERSGGAVGVTAWLPLEPDDCTGRFEMPISVLEFVGIGINLIEFPTVVPEPMNYEYIMGSDSDNSVGSLIDEASKSENMQATCTELRSLDAYQLHAARTTLAQIYGEGNVFADAISRGWHDYIQSLQRQ